MKTHLGATLALCAFAAGADTPRHSDPRLTNPRLSYHSAFDAPLISDVQPADWRSSNELMRSLGGHAGHLRGSPRAEPATATQAPQAVPTPGAAATPTAPASAVPRMPPMAPMAPAPQAHGHHPAGSRP